MAIAHGGHHACGGALADGVLVAFRDRGTETYQSIYFLYNIQRNLTNI